jgi:hypothetical protein
MGVTFQFTTTRVCVCGHSLAAHESSRLAGCGFCRCLRFRLDGIERQLMPAAPPLYKNGWKSNFQGGRYGQARVRAVGASGQGVA